MCFSTCLASGEFGSISVCRFTTCAITFWRDAAMLTAKLLSHLLFCRSCYCQLCILAATFSILQQTMPLMNRSNQSTLETNLRTDNFFSKLVIVALSHQEWKSITLAGRTCCSVEQWNDSGEWVALGPALKGPVSCISFQRATVQVQDFPCHQGTGVRNQLACFTFFWFLLEFPSSAVQIINCLASCISVGSVSVLCTE